MNQTKVVQVTLAAYRRVEWNGSLRVPGSFAAEQVQAAAKDVMDQLAGDDFRTDYDYWEAIPPDIHESPSEPKSSPSGHDTVDFIVDEDFTIRRA